MTSILKTCNLCFVPAMTIIFSLLCTHYSCISIYDTYNIRAYVMIKDTNKLGNTLRGRFPVYDTFHVTISLLISICLYFYRKCFTILNVI